MKFIAIIFAIFAISISADAQTIDLSGATVTTVTYTNVLAVDNSTGKMTPVALQIMQITKADGTVESFVKTDDSSLKNIRTKYANGTFAGNVELNSEWKIFSYSRSNRYSIDTDTNTPFRDSQLVCK